MKNLIDDNPKTDMQTLPSENAGYTIIKQEEVTDIDGTKLGTVLGKNASGSYVTWDYSYFPKSEYLSGYNNGHYFSGDKCELKANADFHRRTAERIDNIVTSEEIQQDFDEALDMEE